MTVYGISFTYGQIANARYILPVGLRFKTIRKLNTAVEYFIQ